MKKMTFALLCIAVISFVGCKKDTVPTVCFITTGNYTNSTTELHIGDNALFGVEATAAPFGKGISRIDIEYSNGDNGEFFTFDNEGSSSRSWVKTFNTAGNVKLTATAYDANGSSATATLDITVREAGPTVSFLAGQDYISDGGAVYTQTSYNFAVRATPTQPSNSPITRIDVEYSNENGVFNVYDNPGATEAEPVEQAWQKTFSVDGQVTVTAKVTDANGNTTSSSINILVTEIPSPDANPFIGAYVCNNLKSTGHVFAASLPLIGDYDEDFIINLTSGGLVIEAGQTYNDVVITMIIEGETYNFSGTTNGNEMVFEQKEVIMPFNVGGYMNVRLRAKVNGVGTLENNVIDYSSTIDEQAWASINGSPEFPGTITNGVMTGTFTKR